MRADERDERRCVPVKLSEIPLEQRLEAARQAARWEPGDEERQALLAAALWPSNETYWVAA